MTTTVDTLLLQVRDLRTYFRTGEGIARAVDGVTFSVRAGETYALVGESGCGKSVTALSILQLVAKPAGYMAGGSVHLDGREISSLPPVEMRHIRGNRISMIFQEPMRALNPVFTVGNQVAEVLRLHQGLSRSAARKRGVDMLARVGIPDPEQRFDEYPHQMSGGMRQRVMIAMALACRPELLIADEPTTALDVTIQAQILELIRELKNELNAAVLLITHDMGVVRENADRVGVMYAGRIVEEAGQADLFAAPAHPYTQLLLRSLPSRSERDRPLTTIEGRVPRATDFPPGCRFNNRCPLAVDRCREAVPPAFDVATGHRAECWLLGKDVTSVRGGEAPPTLGQPAPPPGEANVGAAFRPPTEGALQVSDLTKHFPIRKGLFKRTVGHVRAVDGIDLTIGRGETLALVGESGCGKTTVGKCLVRLLQPTAGSVRLDGRAVGDMRGAALKQLHRRAQMIFQDPFSSLNPRMMVGEAIVEGMQTHHIGGGAGGRRAAAERIMQRVGLDPAMFTRYPHEFSGGQRQRIGLARALAVEPDLLICDEATSSLDVSVQAQILNLLKAIQQDLGLSYLFITHDLSVVKYLSDRVSVMYLGQIVETGSTAQVFGRPRHPYTRALLSAIPEIDATGKQRIILPGDVPSPANPPAGCRFHPRCPHAAPACRERMPDLDEARDERGSDHLAACIRKDEL